MAEKEKFPKVPPFIIEEEQKPIPADQDMILGILLSSDESQPNTNIKPKQSDAEIQKRATQNLQTIRANLVNGGMSKTLTDSRPFGDNDKGKIGR